MSDFFKGQLDYIFFFYGAAFLLLVPLCLFLQGRTKRKLAWSWLGWFGAAHGANEWLDLLTLSLGSTPALQVARLGLLAISYVFLAEFGRASIAGMKGRGPGRASLLLLAGLAALGGLAGTPGLFAATRYALGFTGGLWAAGALFLAARGVPRTSGPLRAAAVGMAGYALASGLVANPAPFFPASWLNYDSFLAAAGVPIQLIRGLLAVWISGSLCFLALACLDLDRDRRFRSWFRHLMIASMAGLIFLWAGGGFLTHYLGRFADQEMQNDYEDDVKVLRQAIVERMGEADRLAKFVAETPEILPALKDKKPRNVEKVSSLLDRCSETMPQSVCYLMDSQGFTLTSSNRNAPDSFVGKSYAFRPYFQDAAKGSCGRYWALGVTSKEMGYYASCAVRDQTGAILGVAVVKRVIEEIKKVFPDRSLGVIIDPHGIVVMSNHPALVLRSLWPLSLETRRELLASRQFGEGPFAPILARKVPDGGEVLLEGKRLRLLWQPAFWENWSFVILTAMTPIVQARLLGISAIALLSLLLLGFLTVVIIMRASEEGFRQLFEHAVDILILHDKGKITAVNKEACRRLDYTREELLQKSLFDIEVGIGKEDLLTLWEQGGELVTINGMYRCSDGSTFPVEIRAGEISYQGRNLRLAAVRDVTERQEAERALHTERQRLFNLLNELQASIYLKRPDYSVVYANKFFLERFGEPGARLCYEIIFGRRQPCDRCPSSTIFATGQPQEWEATSPNGHTYQVYGYPFADVDGSPLVLEMGIDITARKRAEMELAAREEVLRRSQESYRRLATQLMTFQETERQRLARELHDDLTQRLAVLAMEAETLEMQMSRSPGAAPAKLKEIKNNLVKLSMDVHAISRRLHPSILDDLGLADAIASECASFRQRQGVVVNYHAAGIPAAVPRETAINLYRIAQEALRNISSHAQATTVDVTLIGENDSLNLSIKDNGQGFDTQGKKLAGLGLASMQERAFLIGAEFAIRSQPGNGTRIDVTAPLTRRTA